MEYELQFRNGVTLESITKMVSGNSETVPHGKWMYQMNPDNRDEHWIGSQHDNLEDCLKEAFNEYNNGISKHGFFLIAQVNHYVPHIDTDDIIEHLRDDAQDNHSDLAESFLDDVTRKQERELEEQLNEVLINWLTRHNLHATFGELQNMFKVSASFGSIYEIEPYYE